MLRIFLTCLVFYFSHAALASATPYFDGNIISPNLLDEPSPEQHKKEIKEIIELQNSLTSDEIKQALKGYIITPETLIKQVAPELTRSKYPHLYHLLDRSEETALNTKDLIKSYWKSPRPYQISKDVKLFTKDGSDYAYPSGHATRGYTMAYILGLLIPEKRADFLLATQQITKRRILIGEHFPSDLDAGRQLALIVVGGLIQNSEFQRDLEAAKEEVKNTSCAHPKRDKSL